MYKKFILIIISTLTFIIAGGYIVYRYYMPQLIVRELLKETEPAFLPKNISQKLKNIKSHTNHLSTGVIQSIHQSDISIDQLLDMIDGISEQQAYDFLDKLNNLSEINSSDQVFNLAQKHFAPNFDTEQFRKTFNEKISPDVMRTAIQKANEYRSGNYIDFESAKYILKRILIEKERDFNQQFKPGSD